ncbi:MAG: hypothetical protein RBS07_13845 [Lentimicrobium sp.]|jgi:hypothetical protein|nr:hypothetical protein [Lentimicrobium sp.]
MHKTYQLDFNDFNLKQQQFDHHSLLHGVMHTYRVMLHVLRLGLLTHHYAEAKNAFFAAYIHDMARKHDGYCTQHGTDAANHKLPDYQELFIKNGATQKNMLSIGKACAMHSLGNELQKTDPDWLTVALLKDADALDRIRLGEDDLNVSYLRFSESHDQIDFARKLYFQTNKMPLHSFVDVMKIGDTL